MGIFDWVTGRTAATPTGQAAAAKPPDPPDLTGSSAASPSSVDEPNHDQVRDHLLFPKARYQGHFTPENLAFDSNLQEFAQRVAFLCSLENSGKISGTEAHDSIRELYQELRRSHDGLNLEQP